MRDAREWDENLRALAREENEKVKGDHIADTETHHIAFVFTEESIFPEGRVGGIGDRTRLRRRKRLAGTSCQLVFLMFSI
jgi:hypothetical protein